MTVDPPTRSGMPAAPTTTGGQRGNRVGTLAAYVVAGVLAGVLFLHPVTMAVYWFEFHPDQRQLGSAIRFVMDRARRGFTPSMLAMSGVFIASGGALGAAFGILSRGLARRQQVVDQLERELQRDLVSLIGHGESETVEFKRSVRWDARESRVNRALDDAVTRTIAAFMNHRGGSLLIGVADDGTVVGLEADYATLRRHDRDGLHQYLIGLVERRLGGDLCSLVHIVFHDIAGKDVCRMVIEPARRPVYVVEQGVPRYVLRAGNASRELDIRDALAHIESRRRATTPRGRLHLGRAPA